MGRGRDLRVGLEDRPVPPDHVSDPLLGGGVRVIHRVIGDADLPVLVAQEQEGKGLLLGEGSLLGYGIVADPQDLDAALLEGGVVVAEPATLDRSARGVSFGVEPDQNFLAAEALQRNGFALVRLEAEIRGDITGFECHRWIYLSLPALARPRIGAESDTDQSQLWRIRLGGQRPAGYEP